MKNLFLSALAISFVVLACKKKETENNTSITDSANTQSTYSDTASSPTPTTDSTAGRDSINTKDHIGGRKTSNNNTGNGTGTVNAAVSDTARSTK